MYVSFSILEACYEEETCHAAFMNRPKLSGKEGWTAGYDASEPFSKSSYSTKGCYGYNSGKYKGHYFFSKDTSNSQHPTTAESSTLTGESFRPMCRHSGIHCISYFVLDQISWVYFTLWSPREMVPREMH